MSGTIGSLQCKNRVAASKFDCELLQDPCKCQPRETAVSCTCVHGELESIFQDKQRVLPILTQGVTLHDDAFDLGLTAEMQHVSSLELQLTLKGWKLTTKINKNTCKVKVTTFKGCYKCLTGAKLTTVCTTDFGEAVAHVSCGTNAAFSLQCNAQGRTSTTTLMFSKSQLNIQCIVQCPAGSSQFQLKGDLMFLSIKTKLFNTTTMLAYKNITSFDADLELGFLDSIFEWIGSGISGIISTIIIIIVIIIIVVLTLPLYPVVVNMICYYVKQVYTKYKGKYDSMKEHFMQLYTMKLD